MRLDRLCFATGNAHKLGEVREILAALGVVEPPLVGLDATPAAGLDVEETGDTFAANALLKAAEFGRAAGLPTFADDSGLVVDCLDGRPGVRSARYAATSPERIARVVREVREALATGPARRPTARFVCAMTLWLPPAWELAPIAVEGRVEGEIVLAPRGAGGFGYDPIFLLPERGATMAELSADEKNGLSHRGRALGALVEAMRARRLLT